MPGVSVATHARQRVPRPGLLRAVGPEVLSAAADNDPTNVGTAASVGAQTAYQLSWVALLVAPLLAVVLAIAAQVGVVARSDLQTLTVRRFGRRVGAILLTLVVLVNVVTIAADLQAGASGIGLLVDLDPRWLVVPLGLALVALLLVGRYDEVVAVLRYVLLGFLAFGAAAVLAGPDWSRLLRTSLLPTLSLHHDYVAGGLALLGTTLTSYVYVWETVSRGSEEPLREGPNEGGLALARIGAVVGAVFTAMILWFMLVASAATLGRHQKTVSSAQDAARALGPLAGSRARDLFALGLITSAVVALPVLMATTAYVVGAQFDWRRGLSERVQLARGFYGALVASIALGLAVTLAGVSVIDTLVAASVIGGLGTPFSLILMVLLARDPAVMGARPISGRLAIAGWTVAIVVGGFSLLFVIGAALGEF
jgi:Mn2+/Fe2+ NRAMP family transporter